MWKTGKEEEEEEVDILLGRRVGSVCSFSIYEVRILPPAEDSTLVITDAEVGDSGLYKCHVQNEYGTADSSTVITIKGQQFYQESIFTQPEQTMLSFLFFFLGFTTSVPLAVFFFQESMSTQPARTIPSLPTASSSCAPTTAPTSTTPGSAAAPARWTDSCRHKALTSPTRRRGNKRERDRTSW